MVLPLLYFSPIYMYMYMYIQMSRYCHVHFSLCLSGYKQRWFRLKGNLLFYFKVDEFGSWEVM